RLRVEGHVERPRSFSLAELASLPQTEEVRDFHCVTGWSVKHVRWRGVRLSDFLDEIAPSSGAKSVRFFSAEVPYDDSLTLERALHWIHASAFLALLATGLVLYLPSLSTAISRRGTVKELHLAAAIGWLVAVVAVVSFGDRAALRRTAREIETIDRDDRSWLR